MLKATDWRERLSPGWLLRAFLASRGTIQAPLGPDWRRDLAAIRKTRSLVPLLMNDAAALQILLCARAARPLGGAMAEAGVLMGGSARLICEAKGDVPLHLFDIFATLQVSPGSSAEQEEVRRHFGAIHGQQGPVEQLLAPYPSVHFHPGFFPDSTVDVQHTRFCFVHLDLDLPPSTLAGLKFFQPRLLAGGILLGDDYNDRGVRETFESFFADRRDTMIALPWGQVMIVKQGDD